MDKAHLCRSWFAVAVSMSPFTGLIALPFGITFLFFQPLLVPTTQE